MSKESGGIRLIIVEPCLISATAIFTLVFHSVPENDEKLYWGVKVSSESLQPLVRITNEATSIGNMDSECRMMPNEQS